MRRAAAGGGAAGAAAGRDPDAGGGRVRGDPGDRVAVGQGAGRRRGGGPGPGPEGPAAGVEADPGVAARIRELDGQGRTGAGSPPRPGCRNHQSATRCARPVRSPRARTPLVSSPPLPGRPLASAGMPLPGSGLLASRPRAGRTCCRCCRIRRAGTPSGRWPGSGCWARAPPRCSSPGARYPLAGLLLALPALEGTGLLACAREVYGRLRNGFYGLETMLVLRVFQALLREPRAEGAARIDPRALGRVLGLDRAPEVKTIRRKLGELAAAGKAAELQMAIARRHAAARPDELGFFYIDGHTRAYFGKRDVQKMHVARLKFPGPGTEETWVTDGAGDPLLVVMAEPSTSLAAQIRDLLPRLRDLAGQAEATLCFDRGGWSPDLFADIIDAGFDLLTYRKNERRARDIPDLPAARSPRPPGPATTAGPAATTSPRPRWT